MKKYNLIVPIAGKGTRIKSIGDLPKPMLINSGKSILEWSMDSIDYSECNLIFAVRKEHRLNFAIDEWLRQKFGNDIQVIDVGDTSGACETVYEAIVKSNINRYLPLIVYCSDTYFEPKYKPSDEDFKRDGLILTFKANSPNYSYSVLNQDGDVIETREKEVVSDLASVGVYCFEVGDNFIQASKKYISNCQKENKECHICPVYNYCIAHDDVIKTRNVDKIHIMGTAEEFKFFQNVSSKYLVPNRSFALCCDHSGFNLKQVVKDYFDHKKIQYIDFGCFSTKDCDYGMYVKMVADHVLTNKNFFGMGFCRTGQGINIMANKIQGIRAALIQDEYHAQYAIRHNAANFFSISSDNYLKLPVLDARGFGGKMYDTLKKLLEETFDGGRHQGRLLYTESFSSGEKF